MTYGWSVNGPLFLGTKEGLLSCDTERRAEQVLSAILADLDEGQIRRRIDEPIEAVFGAFMDELAGCTELPPADEILTRFVERIYRQGLRAPRKAADAEAVSLLRLEHYYRKGCHVWMFFEEPGVPARKARLVAQSILARMGRPDTEVFPKQDGLDERSPYGNFINAPLFGALVPEGRTVFVHPAEPTQPYPDQWPLLGGVQRIPEAVHAVTSASFKKAKEFTTSLGVFSYDRIPQQVFYTEVERLTDASGNVFLMATPLQAWADYVYVRKKDWTGIEPAVSSLRIEPEELEQVTASTPEALARNYSNPRVKRFLEGFGKDLKR